MRLRVAPLRRAPAWGPGCGGAGQAYRDPSAGHLAQLSFRVDCADIDLKQSQAVAKNRYAKKDQGFIDAMLASLLRWCRFERQTNQIGMSDSEIELLKTDNSPGTILH